MVERASIRMYEPNEIIFRQGDPSPDLFLIIYGSVKSTVWRGDWRDFVTVQLQTFFDGQMFGEMSDYELK